MKFLFQQPLSTSLMEMAVFCGMKHSDTQDASVLSMLGSLCSQHHLDVSIDVPVTSGFNCPLTGIATPAQHPWVVPEVSTPSTSILDCTPVLHPIETPAKLQRLVPMMSTPSSDDWNHFPIHELQLKKAILRYLSHTKIHLMKKMDRRSCEKTGITKHIENKTGTGCS